LLLKRLLLGDRGIITSGTCNEVRACLLGHDNAEDLEEIHHPDEPYSPKFEHIILDLLNVD
jgi:hypothetical protein